ncbi:MAG: ATP-binding cassette domain-containing protein [Candidatus Lokiarchaeota archaeon]|nr:ATP-binding cassette domain-containing protein [Candidatus Lokiarchaeota archaeon]
MPPLIQFHNFYFRYKGNEVYALNDVNLKIKENKFILLAGETGSGKTSLIRCMNGLIPQFYSGYYKGWVEVNGIDTTNTSIADLSTFVGIVFQNPENQLVSMNVEHEIAFGLENLGIPKDQIKQKIDEVVQLTGIENILNKAPFEISGGEQQRVALASILALNPKILILDEPTSNLDPFFASKILTLLQKIHQERDITIIISEHRLDLLISIVDEIILMNKGKIIEHGEKDEVINNTNFEQLKINKPFIHSLFTNLKSEKLFDGNIPFNLSEAARIIKRLKEGSL